ncbi:MAG: flagellar biosynthetic protein FliR [Pirellulaceae bacterium]|nr:flagellar biosynthetic protein FliR [Pirellulaceae bacterium]
MQQMLALGLGPLLVLACVLLRVGGLVWAAPLVGRYIPPRVRMLLALVVALLITPLHLPLARELPGDPLALILVLVPELMLGLAFGLALLLVSGGVCLAGQLLSQLGGLQAAEGEGQEAGGPLPPLARLIDLVTIAVFLVLGGHRQVLAAVLDSFRWLPPGQAHVPGTLVQALLEVAGQSFELGLRVAAPVVASLLISLGVVGLVSRALPQVHVLSVGFQVNMLVMLGAAFVSLGAMSLVFPQYVAAALEQVTRALAVPG